MEIVCKSCSTKLSIPDAALPKNVPVVNGKCPKCGQVIEIRIPQQEAPASAPSPAPAPAAAAPAPAEPKSAPEPAPAAASPAAAMPAPSPADEEFAEGRRLAMACFDDPGMREEMKSALESIGYSVHIPPKPEDGIHWLRGHKYEVLMVHEDYGGAERPVLKAVQPMAMNMRRHMCVGLVGKELRTFDNMTAFAQSVNFTMAEREVGKAKAIIRQAVAENDQFYAMFRETLREAGKG